MLKIQNLHARAELGRDRALGEIPAERLNVNGGAIALGHPIGATGGRNHRVHLGRMLPVARDRVVVVKRLDRHGEPQLRRGDPQP